VEIPRDRSDEGDVAVQFRDVSYGSFEHLLKH